MRQPYLNMLESVLIWTLENVLNSSVEKVRRCCTNFTPKKQHIWHFPGSGFLVGNSPSLLNGVGNLPSTVIYYWKMFDSHKQYRWDFLAAGKFATVICSIDKAFVTLENVLPSYRVQCSVSMHWKKCDGHIKESKGNANLNRGRIESNLNLPAIPDCRDRALVKSFLLRPHNPHVS